MTDLHLHASARSIGLIRVVVFGMWLLKMATDPFQDLARLPFDLYRPVGFLGPFPQAMWVAVLTPQVLLAYRCALLLALAAAVAGVGGRRACLLAALMTLLEQAVVRGFGPYNHAEMAPMLAALMLPMFPCTDALAWPRSKVVAGDASIYRTCAVTLAAMLCMTYFFPAAKRVFSDFGLIFSGELRWYALSNSWHDSKAWSPLARAFITSRAGGFFLWLGLPVVTAFELAAPAALLSRRFRYAFLAVMLVFHALSAFVMNVVFWQNMVLLPLFLLDIEPDGALPADEFR